MTLYALAYTLVPHFAELRAPHRTRHLELVWEACARGEIVPHHGAIASEWIADDLLLFRDATSAKRFALVDPYVAYGLILAWRVDPTPRKLTSPRHPSPRPAPGC